MKVIESMIDRFALASTMLTLAFWAVISPRFVRWVLREHKDFDSGSTETENEQRKRNV